MESQEADKPERLNTHSTSLLMPLYVTSRGDRDLGVAFQTHPGRQASISSGSKEPRSAPKALTWLGLIPDDWELWPPTRAAPLGLG